MSEYQYYEFLAIDQPLSAKDQEYLHTLSSRVVLTPVSAAFTYNYSDFRGDPLKVLARCFDTRVREIAATYRNRPALLGRLRERGLLR